MISALKGMKDLLDDEARLYESIVLTASKVAKNYDFKFINTPHLELTSLFKRSVGESSDIVGKEMYEFIDKGQNHVCLRPEGTAGVVRAYIEHKFDKTKAVKRWFYHGSMFRYERPQKGRLREFHQFGVESFGVSSFYEDANLILMAQDILNALKIKANLWLNSLGCAQCRSEFTRKFKEFIEERQNSDEKGFCQDCLRRKDLNIIRILDCKNEHCQSLLKNHPKLSECLCEACKRDFNGVCSVLKAENLDFILDDSLVRGLDYYSKTAFEFESEEIGAKAAIIGGGRYDKLIADLGGKEGFGIGFAMGIERIMEILKQRKSAQKRSGIYLCALDEEYIKPLFKIASNLRKNHQVFLSYEPKKLAKHLNSADILNYELFLCMGESEAQNQSLFYKNLSTKEEKSVKIDELETFLRSLAYAK